MLNLIEHLPVELVGTHVLGYLSIKDIVMLERACGSKKSQHCFLENLLHRPPVVLPSSKHRDILALKWFEKRRSKITSLSIQLERGAPSLHVNNIIVENFNLEIDSGMTMERCSHFIQSNTGNLVETIDIYGYHSKEVLEQLSACTGNVKKLKIKNSDIDWLSISLLEKWNLNEIIFDGCSITLPSLLLIVQTCTELTSIKLHSTSVDDAAVFAIAQHCPKLEILRLSRYCQITYNSLLTLSNYKLPLKELVIPRIPDIPTVDAAGRCSHALSCIRVLNTCYMQQNDQDASMFIPYMTGLTSVDLRYYRDEYIPLLTQYCHKLTTILALSSNYTLESIMSLCRVNPLLQSLFSYVDYGITDTALIELIHTCPHIHTLYLPYETAITDIGILALSEHCPQLQELEIYNCHQITEAAVLQLLQRCRKLTRLDVSSSSLSKETWTQLDRNTQKRVSRWK